MEVSLREDLDYGRPVHELDLGEQILQELDDGLEVPQGLLLDGGEGIPADEGMKLLHQDRA